MKTIDDFYPPLSEQKSIEQTDTFSGNEIEALKNAAFKAGVRFAEEWIDVNDELPEKQEKPYRVLVLGADGTIDMKWILTQSDFEIMKKYFTHWRPINRK